MTAIYNLDGPVDYINNVTIQSMIDARFAVISNSSEVEYIPVKKCTNQTLDNNLLCADWSSFTK